MPVIRVALAGLKAEDRSRQLFKTLHTFKKDVASASADTWQECSSAGHESPETIFGGVLVDLVHELWGDGDVRPIKPPKVKP